MSLLDREFSQMAGDRVQGKMLGIIRGSKKGGAPEMTGQQKLRVRKHKNPEVYGTTGSLATKKMPPPGRDSRVLRLLLDAAWR